MSFWRAFRVAAGLGWKIESNWTDPLLFAIYSIIRPLAHAAILVVMYGIVSRGRFDTPLFVFMFLGNAFYIFVAAVITGVSWGVIDDRERYKTLKYIYLAPIAVPAYLMGRGVARLVVGALSVALTLAAGVLFLSVPIRWGHVDWPLFGASMVLGLVSLAMIGLIIGGLTLLVAHHVQVIGEAVAGALFLVSGALFPLDVLPGWLRPVGLSLPVTYWLELVRRSLLGDDALPALTGLASLTSLEMLGILAGLTLLVTVAGAFLFRLADHRAREWGLLDRVTNY